MPLYEYQCQRCGKNFEELQSFKDKPLKICKFCGGPANRIISQTSFSLKGEGWFKDGYSKKPATTEKPSAGQTPAAKSPSAGKDSGSSN